MRTGLCVLLALTTVQWPLNRAARLGEPCEPNSNDCEGYHVACRRRGQAPRHCVCEAGRVDYPKLPGNCVTRAQLGRSGTHRDNCAHSGCRGVLYCDVTQMPLVCRCPPGTPWDVDLRVCFSDSYGAGCTTTIDGQGGLCGGGLYCLLGKCACGGNTPVRDDTRRECEGYDHGVGCKGHDCYVGLACRGGTCQCDPKYFSWDAVNRRCLGVPYAQRCTPTQECEGEGVQCLANVCRCPDGQAYKVRDNKCGPKTLVTINGPCDSSDDCVSTANLICKDKVCACAANEEWIEAKCQAKDNPTVVEECDPFEDPDSCSTSFKNLMCDEALKICACAPPRTEFSVAAQACKLTFGQWCRVNDTSVHDLCLSQHCGDDPDQTEDFGKCACATVNGVRQTWSSEPGAGCVEDRYTLNCDSGHADPCGHDGQNPNRARLTCQNGQCLCEDDRAYVYAYCVDANRNHDESCDEYAIDNTCRLEGTSLTCLDDGTGPKYTCLPRRIHPRKSTNQKPVFVPLFWNGETQKCDLRQLSDFCYTGYECASGVCVGSKCVSKQPKRKSGGTQNEAQFLKILLGIAAILVLID